MNIQNIIIEYIDSDENSEENFQNLIKKIDDLKIKESKYDLKILLHMISKIAIIYEINVNSDFQNNFILYTIGEETPSIQNPVIFSHYREEINTFAALSDEEIQSPQMSAIITNSLGMTYIIFIEKIFLNENYLDEIGRDQLKNEIKNEFTIKLQKSNFSYV